MPYIVGHRGAAGVEPENTLRGFRYAIDLGCDYLECDVHLSKDKHLVVIHDDTVDRTTTGSGRVADLTLAELRQLDAGEGEQIPTLDEVLTLIRGQVALLCELKGPFTPEATARAVMNANLQDQVIFTSFEFGRLARIKQLNPQLEIGATFGQPAPDALEQAMALGANSVGIRHQAITRDFVEQARRYGLNLRAWNPDSEADIQRMIDLDPMGISSNYPHRVMKLLGRKG